MISGRDALHRIDGAIADARRNLSRTSEAASAGASRIAVIERDEAAAYHRLGAIRLDILQTDETVSSLGGVDEKAERLLEKHEGYLAALEHKLDAAADAIRTLESARREQEKVVDAAIATHEDAAAASLERLASDPDYLSRANALEEANAIAARAAQKLEIAHSDRTEKGAPYENDKLFNYLLKGKFGTKDYRAFFLFAAFDRWVAGLIKYRDARLNYMRLLELPERLGEHAERVDAAAEKIEQDIEAFERTALERDGVTALRDKAATAQNELERIDTEITAAEERHQKLVREHSDVASGREGPLNDAHQVLANAFAERSIPDLRVLAAETTTLEDDRIVENLITYKRERMEIEESRHALKRTLDSQGRTLSDMEKLRRKFKSARYDSPYSEFTDGGVISIVVGEILRGAISYSDAWRRLQRSQKTRRRNWSDDFGGDEWRDGFGLPQQRGRDWTGGGNWGGSRSGGRLPRPTRRSRPTRMPRTPQPRGGGGFKTGRGF